MSVRDCVNYLKLKSAKEPMFWGPRGRKIRLNRIDQQISSSRFFKPNFTLTSILTSLSLSYRGKTIRQCRILGSYVAWGGELRFRSQELSTLRQIPLLPLFYSSSFELTHYPQPLYPLASLSQRHRGPRHRGPRISTTYSQKPVWREATHRNQLNISLIVAFVIKECFNLITFN